MPEFFKYFCGVCAKGIPPDKTFKIETHAMVKQDREGNQYYTETKKFICEGCQ